MEITVKLKLDNPYEFTIEEIENDIRLSENEIGWKYCYKIESVDQCVETKSTVDAVQVVRCKDCKHGHECYGVGMSSIVCEFSNYMNDPNGFCYEGKRKNGEKDKTD